MAPHAETPSQQYIRQAAKNRGLPLDTDASVEPSSFLTALRNHGTPDDMARSMRLLAARDTEDDRSALRRLVVLGLREQHPDATEAELDEAARKLLGHLRGSGLKR